MLLFKYLLTSVGFGMLAVAAAITFHNIYRQLQYRRWSFAVRKEGEVSLSEPKVGWKATKRLAVYAWIPLLMALSMVTPQGGGVVRGAQASRATSQPFQLFLAKPAGRN